MKIINLLGNEYSGSIGKSVTASKWKGRNYLKKWFKPHNPNTGAQQTVRAVMTSAVSAWHGYTSVQKKAYYWYQRYRKAQISAFNALVGLYLYMGHHEATSPGPPPADGPSARDSVTTDPVEGAKIIIRRAGQATDYYTEYTAVSGATPSSVSERDQNYDIFITKSGYMPFSLLDKTAALICVTHDIVSM